MTIVDQLKETPQFKGVKLTDLDELVALMKPESYEGGKCLFQKGDVGDRLYIVVSGTIRIYTHDADGKEFTLSMIGPGRVFGEFSILDQQPRSASAAAEGMLDVLTLSRDDFMTFLPEHPTVGLAMIRNLTDRLRYITMYLNKVTAMGNLLEKGEFDQAVQQIAGMGGEDHDIDRLITTFVELAHNLKAQHENANAGQESST